MRTPVLRGLPMLLAALVAACGETARIEPTAPPIAPPALAINTTYLCLNNPTGQDVQKDLNFLLTGTPRQTAQAQFNDVQKNCTSDLPLAQSQMFLVVRTVLGALPASVRNGWLASSDQAIALARLLNNLFQYVGYDSPRLTSASVVVTGGLYLSDLSADFDLISGDGQAILRVPAGATTGTHLFSITPIGQNCLTTNLEQLGTCYDMSASPAVDQYDKLLTAGICQTRDENLLLDPRRRIAHEVGTLGSTTNVTEVLPLVMLGPIAGFCGEPASSSMLPADASPLERLLHGAARLASAVSRTVGVQTAYAVHGGLGGSTYKTSPFNTVNRDVFQASFDANPLGLLSASDPADRPERGSWSEASYKNPGSITIVADPSAPGNQYAVLNQGGGACTTNCGSLILTGQIDRSYLSTEKANEGVYFIDFTLAQQKPVVKAGPYIVLDSKRNEIARLEYRTTNAGRQLFFNGQLVGTWDVGVKQVFSIVLNYSDVSFNNEGVPKTRLVIRTGGTAACPPGPRIDGWWNFVSSRADDLQFFEANFTRIDAGVFNLDQVRIYREDDPQRADSRLCGLF